MPRPKKDLQQLARAYTNSAVKTLAGIMQSPDAPETSRVKAAEVLLNRGWGMAKQNVTVDAPGLAELLVNLQGDYRGLPSLPSHDNGTNGAEPPKNGNGSVH